MKKNYTLTTTAENDLRDAKIWSLGRWGKALTKQYFQDLHETAQYIATDKASKISENPLYLETGLCIYPVHEHYIIYVPISRNHIVIVAFIKQGRDLPNILSKNRHRFQREIKEIQAQIKNGKIKIL